MCTWCLNIMYLECIRVTIMDTHTFINLYQITYLNLNNEYLSKFGCKNYSFVFFFIKYELKFISHSYFFLKKSHSLLVVFFINFISF